MSTRSDVAVAARLGWVSFLNDCSSEILARAFPLLLTGTLGVSPLFVGVVEGLAEAGAILLRGLSGWLSDRLPSRKPLVTLGYATSVVSRALLWFAAAPAALAGARLLDRVGKGLRTAPRDALIADATAAGMAGRAFALTRFLDTLGAVTGLALALAFGVGTTRLDFAAWHDLLLISLPFGMASVALLVLAVPSLPRATLAKRYVAWRAPREVRGYLLAVGVFSLGNSSDAFWILRAQQLGLDFRATMAVLIGFNLLAASLAVPVGRISDRWGRKPFLVAGWLVFALCYATVAASPSVAVFVTVFLLYGAFYGCTEGIEKALLADLLPPSQRGVGYGALQLVLGAAALPASALTGWLMAAVSPAAAFATCSGLAVAGVALLVMGVEEVPPPLRTA